MGNKMKRMCSTNPYVVGPPYYQPILVPASGPGFQAVIPYDPAQDEYLKQYAESIKKGR
jgi:hypothetical protein